jgi:hypothetical protein
MQTDRIPEIFGPFSNILLDELIDITASGTEQTDNISRSIPIRNRVDGEPETITGPDILIYGPP